MLMLASAWCVVRSRWGRSRGLRQRQQHSGHFNILPSAIESLRSVHFLIKSALRAGCGVGQEGRGGQNILLKLQLFYYLNQASKVVYYEEN